MSRWDYWTSVACGCYGVLGLTCRWCGIFICHHFQTPTCSVAGTAARTTPSTLTRKTWQYFLPYLLSYFCTCMIQILVVFEHREPIFQTSRRVSEKLVVTENATPTHDAVGNWGMAASWDFYNVIEEKRRNNQRYLSRLSSTLIDERNKRFKFIWHK